MSIAESSQPMLNRACVAAPGPMVPPMAHRGCFRSSMEPTGAAHFPDIRFDSSRGGNGMCLHCSSPCRLKSTKRNGELAVAPIQTRKAVVAEHSLKPEAASRSGRRSRYPRDGVEVTPERGYEVVSVCTVKTHSRRWRAISGPTSLLDLMSRLCLPKSHPSVGTSGNEFALFAGLPRGRCARPTTGTSARSPMAEPAAGVRVELCCRKVAASQAARRSYDGGSPRDRQAHDLHSTFGSVTSLRSGASLLSERWVRSCCSRRIGAKAGAVREPRRGRSRGSSILAGTFLRNHVNWLVTFVQTSTCSSPDFRPVLLDLTRRESVTLQSPGAVR